MGWIWASPTLAGLHCKTHVYVCLCMAIHYKPICTFQIIIHPVYYNESNNSNHPIIWTPPFPGKMINYCIPSIRTPMFEIITGIPMSNTYTLRNLNGGHRVSTSLRQSLRSYTVRVTECLLAYYRRFQTSTTLVQSFLNIYLTPTVTEELKWGLPNVY